VRFLPPGVDSDYYAPALEAQESASILYMASGYQWHPNWDAVKWLYEEIMPRVWSRVPEAKLYITGKHTRPEMENWAATGRVTLTGFVPDERTVLAKATVVAVPMRLGGGIKLKILTAFACCRAVVTTSTGAEGMPGLGDGMHLLIRDSAEDFADGLINVIASRQLRQSLEASGRTLACEEYDWRVLAERWEQVLTSIHTPQDGRSSVACFA
jgi:glycosyltransferase involved in cell wall biosynthesis